MDLSNAVPQGLTVEQQQRLNYHIELMRSSDQELSKKILAAMDWEIFEYPEMIPDQDENGDSIESSVSFFGVKTHEGNVFYKGSPFEEDIYKHVHVANFHFMGVLLNYLNANNYAVDIRVYGDSASVEIAHDGKLEMATKTITKLSSLPRNLCEVFLLNLYNKNFI